MARTFCCALLIFFTILTYQVFAKVVGETVEYKADGTALKGYLAYDDSVKGKRPAVLIVPEWWGLNNYVKKRADMIAGLGYTALAVDMYGGGKNSEHPADAQKFVTEVMNNMAIGEKRFDAALEFLKKQPAVNPDEIAAIGYCFGGGVVLYMASVGADLKGVVSFHGALGVAAKPEPGSVKAKILVLTGGDDNFVTPEDVDAFRKEMGAANADYEIIVYPGAKHSFTNPDADRLGKENNMPIAYNEDADKNSWAEMEKFLKEVFQAGN